MKGIQVSIDVSESEIVPKAFQRPAVSGVRPECVFCGRQAKKISSHRHGGGRGVGGWGGRQKMCQKCFWFSRRMKVTETIISHFLILDRNVCVEAWG